MNTFYAHIILDEGESCISLALDGTQYNLVVITVVLIHYWKILVLYFHPDLHMQDNKNYLFGLVCHK